MQTNTQQRLSRALGFLLAAVVVLPSQLTATPAHATATGAPGVIPAVRYDGNGAQSVSLSWDAPRSAGTFAVSDYVVEYKGAGSSWTVFDDGLSTERSATVTGLEPGREYEFRVAAVNPAGVGPASTLGIGENFQSSSMGTCAVNPSGENICFESKVPYVNRVYFDDPNGVLPVTNVSDVVKEVGYSQSWTVDLQCWLSKSAGVLCVSRFNEQGQQGRGYVGPPAGTYKVPGLPDNIVDISVVGNTACALSANGDLWCWGRWSSNRVGRQLLEPTLQLRGVKDVGGLCAIQWDQTIACVATDNVVYRWVTNPAAPTALKLDSSGANSCAITTERTVICFSNIAAAFSTITNLTEIVEFDYRADHWCALDVIGIVTCSGANEVGQLGDGSYARGPTRTRLPEPVVHLASSDEAAGPTRRSCAIGVSSTVYCWGELIQGMGVSTLPKVMSGFGGWTAHAAVSPSQVSGLVQTGRTAKSVTVSWAAPESGDFPITSYLVSWRLAGGTWATATISSATTSWRSPELPTQSSVEVKVAAVSSAGTGLTSNPITVSTASPPLRPMAPTVTGTTGNSVSISWRPASSPHEPVTGYRIEWSTDRTTWQSRSAVSTESTATITGLSAGSAISIRISALNAAGASSYSDTVVAFTSGLVSHTIAVEDATGQPVYGGQVTWRKQDGTFESALDYGLTVDGRATFPYIPAGLMNVTLTDVQLLGGAIVDYNTNAIVGYSTDTVISLPPEPSESQHVVRVVLNNGLPVVGAYVFVSILEGTAVVDGATFTTPEVTVDGTTNEFGEVYLSGYSTANSLVTVEYSDGILIQRATARLGRGDVTVVMEDMPWIETPVVTSESSVGSLVTLTVTTESAGSSRNGLQRVAPGATIAIDPPKGSAQTCSGKKLSAAVGVDGTATLKVCASKSGRYVLRGKGVVSTGAVSLKVKGTAPLPVDRARAVSPSHGDVTVTWNAPTYSGGNPVTKYTVTLKRGKKTHTKVVSGTSASFTKLPGTTQWSVTVTATSKFGTSEPVRMVVPVS